MPDDTKMDVDQKKNQDNDLKDVKESERKTSSPTKESKDSTEKEYKDKKKDKNESKDKESTENKSSNSKEKTDEKKKSTVDREKVCPFLLRVFCKRGNHHRIDEFTINHQPVEDEIQIYTWKDASLREIASLLAEVDPKYAKYGNSISFKSIYLDSVRARYNSKDLGVINISKPSTTDDVTLEDNRFIIGDFIDVALQSYSDTYRRYDRQDNFSRIGGRFGNIRSSGFSFDKKRKIGERHDRFSSRNDRRGSFRNDRF